MLIDYFGPFSMAIDSVTGAPVGDVVAQVFDLSDTALTTPLPITDMQDIPMPTLNASDNGLFPAFKCPGHTQVYAVSGGITTPIMSMYALLLAGLPDPSTLADGFTLETLGGEWVAKEPVAGATDIPVPSGAPDGSLLVVQDGAYVLIAGAGGLPSTAGVAEGTPVTVDGSGAFVLDPALPILLHNSDTGWHAEYWPNLVQFYSDGGGPAAELTGDNLLMSAGGGSTKHGVFKYNRFDFTDVVGGGGHTASLLAGVSLVIQEPGGDAGVLGTGRVTVGSTTTGMQASLSGEDGIRYLDFGQSASATFMWPIFTGPTSAYIQLPGATGTIALLEDSVILPLSKTSSYSLALGDERKCVEVTSASATTVTIPTNASQAFPVGTVLEVLQVGAGQVTIAGASGVTVNAPAGLTKTKQQWSTVRLRKRATDTWVLSGDLG